jgi:RNA-directed DNA polymerase
VFTGSLPKGEGGSRPICLLEAARVKIIRHVKIRGDANPYDPKWEEYFEERLYRRMQSTLTGQGRIQHLWLEQHGRCRVCGQLLQEGEEWQVHHLVRRSHGGDDGLDNLELLHANCHRQLHSQEEETEADCVPRGALEKA